MTTESVSQQSSCKSGGGQSDGTPADRRGLARAIVLLATPEPQFLLPGSVAVIVGTAAGYAATGTVNWLLALLAVASIVCLNAGSNMLNDYFDHLSGNDWLNDNVTAFGGGSRYIQNGIVTPRQMLISGAGALATGCLIGLVIVLLTRSWFILALGIAGAAGGLFWTAPPVRFCYRFIGEPYIFLLFGPLPVYGAFYLQTGEFKTWPLWPGVIVGLLIAMVAEVNSFPDREADTKVDKRTFVVRYGVRAGVLLYRVCISGSFFIAWFSIIFVEQMVCPAGLLTLTLPLALAAMWSANEDNLATPGCDTPNKFTIILHSAAGAAMTAGFIIYRLVNY
jgi:1,4-dihydroxy-2-naphthoate octaprenyltransferase